MIPLRKVLQTIENGLKVLVERTQDMERMLDTLEGVLTAEKPTTGKPAKAKRARKKPGRKARAKKPTEKRAPKRTAKRTGTASVLGIIEKSREGIDTATLKKKTGLKDNNIRTIIYRLKKEGKIKSEKKGIYVKA